MAAKEKISAEVIADVTSIDRQKERPSLPQSAKAQSLEQEKNPGKKADDYQSSVARYIVQNHACALPTMTVHFVLFVFVCLSLVLMWWRPCTLGHESLTCVHRRPPSPPFNYFVPPPLALCFTPLLPCLSTLANSKRVKFGQRLFKTHPHVSGYIFIWDTNGWRKRWQE